MGGRAATRRVVLLLIGVLLVCVACTRPKPRASEDIIEPEVVVPTLQLTPGQTVVSVREIATLVSSPTPEVPVVPLPTTPPTITPIPTEGPSPVPTAIAPVVQPTTAAPVPLPTAAPTPVAQEAPTAPPSTTLPATHTVQRGETLFSIGRRYGVPWQQIAQANGIAAPYQIISGQKLTIPRPGSASAAPAPAPAPPASGRTHVVQQGENLFRIGLKYGVPWQEIAQANGITDPTQVKVGQRLVIP
jgi:lipoprotein NlpD